MRYCSLFDLWNRTCSVYGDKIAFTDNTEQENITYEQAFREICFLAEKLKEFGIKRFDNVCLFAVNSPRWLIIEQAVITLGAVCVSKTSEINITELDYVFNNSDSVALITDNPEIIEHFVKTLNFNYFSIFSVFIFNFFCTYIILCGIFIKINI